MIKIFVLEKNLGNQFSVNFEDNTNTVANTSIYMIVLCDSGNTNNLNPSSVVGVPITGTNTGL